MLSFKTPDFFFKEDILAEHNALVWGVKLSFSTMVSSASQVFVKDDPTNSSRLV
jgi:hypothetical protein